jgi:spore coat protein U-like protein
MGTMIVRKLRFAVLFLALAAFPATPAQRIPGQRIPGDIIPRPGVTDNAVLPVTIEIVSYCNVSSPDLDFGAYASNSTTPARGQTNISLTCSGGITVELSLDTGTSPGRPRRLSQESGTDRLEDDLYQDPGRTIYWGDRSGVDTLEVLTTGVAQTVPIYGEIPAGQRAREGTYSDVITITVHF